MNLAQVKCKREFQNRQRLGFRSPMVRATKVRNHIRQLNALGVSINDVARAAGVPERTVASIASGGVQSMHREWWVDQILSVDHRPHPSQRRALTIGARRRVQALGFIGYPQHMIETEIGVNRAVLAAFFRHQVMPYGRWKAIADVYEAWSGTPGPSDFSRRVARSKGWASPLAWEDLDIDDPHATPDLIGDRTAPVATDMVAVRKALAGYRIHLTVKEKQEAVRLARAWGWSCDEYADVMRVTRSSVKAAWYRHNQRTRA